MTQRDQKHIVIDARIINSSTGRYVERLIHYLEEVDTTNRYTLLVPSKDFSFYTPRNPNFTVKAADFANYSFAEQTSFLSFLNSLDADLVHFCMPQQPVLYNKPHITTVHDLTLLKTYNSDKNWLVYHLKQLVGRFVFWRLCHTNQRVLVPTHYTKHELEQFSRAAKGKTIVTYEAADKLHSGKTVAYPHPYKQFLLYVGQQSDYKNLVRLAEAHQQLLGDHPDLGLILVGKLNASAQKNKRLFESRGYQNITFTDFIDDTQRDWLYEHCTAYVFPSLMEGFGLPGLEAMLYDAPVVSSNATCLPEVYGEAAHYFDPYDTDDIARALRDVLTDNKLRQQLIKKGRKRVQRYSWRRMAEQTHQAYLAILDETK